MSFKRKNFISNEFNKTDINIIKWQLGRKKVFIGGLIERCKFGFPQIMLMSPQKGVNGNNDLNYEAVSNLMWLTCPYLNDKIHSIESDGFIKHLAEIIDSDVDLRLKMKNAHANFYFLRNYILNKYIGDIFPNDKMDVLKSGIGGIRDLVSLKCLHIHFCHYRVYKNNIAGLLTFHLLNKKVSCKGVMCNNAT